MKYNYNQIIEYIDGTLDLNFKGAQQWASAHGTSFQERMDLRALPKRYFQIGEEPVVPVPTREEIRQMRAGAYVREKDPITCQIQSLRDEEQTPEVVTEIEELLEKRAAVVEAIHERFPYPDE